MANLERYRVCLSRSVRDETKSLLINLVNKGFKYKDKKEYMDEVEVEGYDSQLPQVGP